MIKKDAPQPSSIYKYLNWEERETEKAVGEIFMLEPIKDLRSQTIKFLDILKIKYNEEAIEGVIDILADEYVNYNIPYDKTLETLERLKLDYSLGLITNSTDLAFEPLRKKYSFDKIFDKIIASYEVGLIKPDPRIFELALGKLGVKSKEALMVGDNPINDLQAARAVGIKGLMLDNKNKYPNYTPRIASITEIFNYLSQNL